MNNGDFIGLALTDPATRFTDNQTPVAEFMVAIPSTKTDDPPGRFTVFCYGRLAEAVQQNVKAGLSLKIQGRIRIDTVDNPAGYKEKVATIQAGRINSLKVIADATSKLVSGSPAQQQAPAPVAPPAPSPAPVAQGQATNYDDIPF